MLDGHVGVRRRLAHRAAAVRLVDGVGLGLVRVRVRVRGRARVSLVDGVGLGLGQVRRAARAQSLAPQAAGAASRGTTAKTAPSIVQQGGCGVAAGEHLLGLLGRPVVELEGEWLGDVRADVPAASSSGE
eukprot:scaffold61700_cov66-Phaeocystis_antarctica.AAC.1